MEGYIEELMVIAMLLIGGACLFFTYLSVVNTEIFQEEKDKRKTK